MADGTLIFDTKLDSSGAEAGLSKFGSTAKSALGTVAAAGTAALAAGTTAAAALTKSAVDAYADFEQLTGGVETLFKDSAQTVKMYAWGASDAAGLSANEYMETVTSFSASLLQSLGGDTAAAAEMANKAIVDMSDNANKMGSDMTSIQNAYQGFAKQNYTMLDNLKLGYGGTKEEMQRLLNDAGKLANTKFDLSSYSDVIEAIHVIQENMDITGTTAKEASTTISGSLQALKAEWENVMVSVANGDGFDMDAIAYGLVEKVKTVLNNLKPVILDSLKGLSLLIEYIVPYITEELPGLISELLPSLLSSATALVNGVINALPSLLQVLLKQLPTIVTSICNTLISNLPMIIKVGLEMIVELAKGIAQALPELIPQLVDVVLDIVDTLLDNIDLLIDAGIQLMVGLAEGLSEALPRIIERLPEIIIKICDALIRNAPKMMDASLQIMLALGNGIVKCIPEVMKAIPKIISGIWDALKEGWPKMQDAGLNLIKGLGLGIVNARSWLIGKIKELCHNALGTIKDFFGIASPSKKFKWIGEMCVEGMAEGLEDMDSLADGVTASLGNITANVSGGNVGAATNGGIAGAVAQVLEGMGVYMDGRAVGQVTAESVNDTLGRFAVRRA